MMRRRRIFALLLAPALVLTLAAAKPFPKIVPLPEDWAAEGIEVVDQTFYAGSLVDGDIYRGNLRTGEGEVFIDVSGRQALGLKVDRRHHLLFVAGGFAGHAYVYDSDTGAEVADLDLADNLVNDVVVTRQAAYFTDSFAPVLYKVPIDAHGNLGPPETLVLTGPAGAPTESFGLNGIDASVDGKRLIVARTDFAGLYTVDPDSGVSEQIAVTGGTLAEGTVDGILLAGQDLWVVENFANRLTRVRLSADWSTASVQATVTDPAFQIPATVARHGSRLVVVNTKFDLGFPPPVGPGAPPGTPFEVVQLKAP